MADVELTLDDLDAASAASPEYTVEGIAVPRQPAQGGPEVSTLTGVKAIARRDFAAYGIARTFADSGIPLDESFEVGSMPKEEWAEVTEGLSEDEQMRLADAARSKAHLYWLADIAREQQGYTKTATDAFGTGAGLFFTTLGVNILDPTAIGLAIATGPMGVATKAERMARALSTTTSVMQRRAAVTAINDALKAGHTGNVLRTGAIAGGENLALDLASMGSDVTRDPWDLGYSVLGGVTVGAIAGRYLSGAERVQLQRLHQREVARLEMDELREAITAKRNAITGQLPVSVDEARAQVGKAELYAVRQISMRDADVSDYGRFRHVLESNGKADAANPNSSAVGIDQFTEGTWLGIVGKAKPEWAKGLSKEQLLALRKDPQKSAEMVAKLDEENTAALRRANAPVNHFTLYAAHHFGASKGVRFALAGLDTKMEDILTPGQLKANPYLKGKTKADALANWAKRAEKGGVDVDGLIDRVASTPAEARRQAQIAAFDRDGAETRVRQLEEEVNAHEARLAQLQKDTEGELPAGQLRKLEREVAALEKELSAHKGTPTAKLRDKVAEVERKLTELEARREPLLQRLREEDDLAMTPEVSRTKHREKLREANVERILDVDRKSLKRERMQAKHDLGRARYATRERLTPLKRQRDAAARAAKAREELRNLSRSQDQAFRQSEVAKLREALGLDTSNRNALKQAAESLDEDRAFLKQVKPWKQSLKQLDDLDNVKTAADLRTQQLAETGRADAFGADTLSAARTLGFDEGMYSSLEGTSSGAPMAKMKLSGALNLWGKGTFSGVLRGSDYEVVRTELGPLISNSLGNADNSAVSAGADEIAVQIQRKHLGRFNAAVDPAYKAWMKEQGISGWRKHSRSVRTLFMNELGLHIRGMDSESAAVKSAAAPVREVFASFLKEAKEAGVKGFENVEANANWLPRVFDFHRFHELNQRFGPDQLATLVQRGIQAVNTGIDDETALKVATAYIKRMRELRMGNDAGLMQGMSFDDTGWLRQFLNESGMASDEVETIVSRFAQNKLAEKPSKGEGSFRHAKMRQKFDENFTMELYDKAANDGTRVKVTISALFENNVEALMGRYSRTMAGHIGLAKVGIKSRADFETRLRRVERALENDEAEWKAVQEKARAAYDLITARPLTDSNLWTELGRTGRDLSYATQMENAGLSNVPDIASLLAWGNFRYTMKSVFGGDVFGDMWKRGADGRLADEFWREVEESTGLGTDFLNNQIHSSYDVSEEYAQELVSGTALARAVSQGFGTVAHGARVAGRGVTMASGLAGITTLSQRIAARNIIYRIKDDVLKGGKFSDARAAALGLDEAMKKRIADQLKKHTVWAKGEFGGDIQRVEFVKWDDIDARDAFLYAVHREARKNIQESNIGDTFLLQHSPLGKVITQFRNFGITAWTKQTLRGIAERDAEAATRVALQFTLAAGVWMLRHKMVVAGMEAAGTDPEKIEKYREDNLTPARIIAAATRNSGFAALLPDVYDSTVGTAFGTPLFDVRNSGLSSNMVTGIPSVALAGNIVNAGAGTFQSIVRDDREYTQGVNRSTQAIVPLGNYLLAAPAWEAMRADMPTGHEDDDPDDADWAIFD